MTYSCWRGSPKDRCKNAITIYCIHILVPKSSSWWANEQCLLYILKYITSYKLYLCLHLEQMNKRCGAADSKPQITIWQRDPTGVLLIRPQGHQSIRSRMPAGERWAGHLSMYTVLQLQVSPAHTPALATSQCLACLWVYIYGCHNTVRCAVANISINCCLTMPIGKRCKEQRLCP